MSPAEQIARILCLPNPQALAAISVIVNEGKKHPAVAVSVGLEKSLRLIESLKKPDLLPLFVGGLLIGEQIGQNPGDPRIAELVRVLQDEADRHYAEVKGETYV